MEQQQKVEESKDDTIAIVWAILSVVAVILLVLFVWFDMYHRIAHVGDGINLCRLFAELSRQEITQYTHGMCR